MHLRLRTLNNLLRFHFLVIKMSAEDLQQEVATLKAIVANQEEKIDSLVEELEKI